MELLNLVSAWRRRSLPSSLASLRGVKMASYSQFGEDSVVNGLLGTGYPKGHYVDVGCFHPIKWSNTYAFYRRDWSGICIDPNAEFAKAWRKYRGRDKFVNCGVSDSDGEASYVKRSDIPQENYLKSSNNTLRTHGGEEVAVQLKRLDSILLEHFSRDQTIDLMSIDCEGYDLTVLRSNDFDLFRPRILIVEDLDKSDSSEIHQYCIENEYGLVGICGASKIFKDLRWRRSSA